MTARDDLPTRDRRSMAAYVHQQTDGEKPSP